MMTAFLRLTGPMRRLANWRLVIVSGVVFTAFAALLFRSAAPFGIPNVKDLCGQPPPDVRLFVSAQDVQRFMAACGDAGRAAYRNLQLADLFYPAVSALFMASVLATALSSNSRHGSSWVAVASLPLLGAGLDYLENAAAWFVLLRYPDESAAAAALFSAASATKLSVNWMAGILLIIVLAYGLLRRTTRRQKRA